MIAQIISQTLGLSSPGSEASPPPVAEQPPVQGRQEQSRSDTESGQVRDKVRLSETGVELSRKLPEDQPDWQQVRAMAAQLSTNMDSLFLKAGVDTSQPIRINIHPYTGIPFVGEHPDKSRIQNLLDHTPDLLEQIRQVNAVASYSYQASQSQHGLNSNATVSLQNNNAATPPNMPSQASLRQSAMELYEENLQTTRLSMAYYPQQGIDLDVISLNQPRRQP